MVIPANADFRMTVYSQHDIFFSFPRANGTQGLSKSIVEDSKHSKLKTPPAPAAGKTARHKFSRDFMFGDDEQHNKFILFLLI